MHFQYFKFELNFLENSNLFKKLKYRFLVESTKISKITFPYKTAMPEANLKGVSPGIILFFRKFCFSLRTSYKELI